MRIVENFNVDLWESLGFIFKISKNYDDSDTWKTWKRFDDFIFSLSINTRSGFTMGAVQRLNSCDEEHHILSESEALEWFSGKSQTFKKTFIQCCQKDSSKNEVTN